MLTQPGSVSCTERACRNLPASAVVGTRLANGMSMAIADHLPAEAALPTRFGDFRIGVYRALGTEVAAITRGSLGSGGPMLVRLHSQWLTGDALGSLRCDCGEQLQQALETIANEDRGILLYLPPQGPGLGPYGKNPPDPLPGR